MKISKSRRGLLVGASLATNAVTGTISTSNQDLSRQLIRQWVLFWDEIRLVDQGYLGGSDLPDIDFLKDVGFATVEPREHVTVSVRGNFIPELNSYFSRIMNKKEFEDPGTWALRLGRELTSLKGMTFLQSYHPLTGVCS